MQIIGLISRFRRLEQQWYVTNSLWQSLEWYVCIIHVSL